MIVAATASTVALRRLPRVFVSFKKPCAVIVVPRSSEKSTGSPVFSASSAPKARAFCALVLVHDLYGACEQLAFIAYGNARTRFAEVYT